METNFGLQRFNNQFDKLSEYILLANNSKNPALTFYKSNARQTLFFLEALARLYKEIHNKDIFKSLKDDFKTLEDQLGKVDYYETYHKELALIPNFPTEIIDHLKSNYEAELQTLATILIVNGWLKDKLDSIKNELLEADWLKPDEERRAIAKAISKEIKSIREDYDSGELNFRDLEKGVHEFRRQIRWISIYAQGLNGLIQLKQDDLSKKLSAYLSKDIIDSKFNVMPAASVFVEPIKLSQSAFYALSWLIAKSGDLKDEGLKLICVEESMKALDYLPESEIPIQAMKLLPSLRKLPNEIKSEMKVLANQFINEDKILDILRADFKAVYKD